MASPVCEGFDPPTDSPASTIYCTHGRTSPPPSRTISFGVTLANKLILTLPCTFSFRSNRGGYTRCLVRSASPDQGTSLAPAMPRRKGATAPPSFLEHEVCAVCDEGDGGEEDDPLISCATCKLVVHAFCYGDGQKHMLKTVEEARAAPAKALRCALCVKGHSSETPPCFFCSSANAGNRAMKAEAEESAGKGGGSWAHITCVQWTPGAYFVNAEGKDGFSRDDVPPALFKQRCALCAPGGGAHAAATASRDVRGRGAPLRCSRGRCTVAFHVLCARRAGWEQSVSDSALGLRFRGFCGQHSADAHLKAAAAFASPCVVCKERKGGRDGDALLCDDCDASYHLGCLSPPLAAVPEGEWYCPACMRRRVVLGTVMPEATLRGALVRGGVARRAAAAAAAGGGPVTLAAALASRAAAQPPPALAFSDDEEDEEGGGAGRLSDDDDDEEEEGGGGAEGGAEGSGSDSDSGFRRRRPGGGQRGRGGGGATAKTADASSLREAVLALTTAPTGAGGKRRRAAQAAPETEDISIEVGGSPAHTPAPPVTPAAPCRLLSSVRGQRTRVRPRTLRLRGGRGGATLCASTTPLRSRGSAGCTAGSECAPFAPPPPSTPLSLLRRFPAWHAHLRAGASLLLYGVGDKDDVALAFVAQTCPEARLVVADGASPACSVRRILATLGHAGRGAGGAGRNGGAAAQGKWASRNGRADDESSGGGSSSGESDDDDGSVADAFPDDGDARPSAAAVASDAAALEEAPDGPWSAPSAPATPSQSIARVSASFFHRPVSTVLVVRSLDALVQRSEARRRSGGAAMPLLLAALAAQPSLRLVATVDHVNAPLLIDEEATLRGRLVRRERKQPCPPPPPPPLHPTSPQLWVECTTFAVRPPGSVRLAARGLTGGGSAGATAGSLEWVLRSLTQNHAKILR